MAVRLAKTASPMAVRGPRMMFCRFCLISSWSVVGDTITWATPENTTKPRLRRDGTMSTKALAASWAATIRVGATSVASIDSETSMAITMVARSRGTLICLAGWAKAVTMKPRARRNAVAGTCRRHPGRLGAMESRRARLVKRTAHVLRRPCMST
jgi:hypothetical protein